MTDGPAEPTGAMPAVPPTSEGVDDGGWRLGGRYRVLDRLGAGGMAEVFRAHDEQLDRDVAVKVFRTLPDEPGNAGAPERRERELRALAQLSHPNLITLYDANVLDGHPFFLVTELVRGPSLAARLEQGPLPEPLARTVGAQIADALNYVHELGMVHRDVKPANILLGEDGTDATVPGTAGVRARLSDFGIVRLVDSSRLTAADFTLGTATYLAPEQARGSDVDQAADVYSLGLVLIETLTGRRSFDGSVHEALAARLAHAPEIPSDLPQPWPGLLAAMTSSDPTLRPTAAEVARALRSTAPVTPVLAPQQPPVAVPVPMPAVLAPDAAAAEPDVYPIEPVEPPRRRRPGMAVTAAALACAAIIAAAAILLLRPSSDTPTRSGDDQTVPSQTAAHSAGDRSSTLHNEAPVAVRSRGAATSSSSPDSSRTKHPSKAAHRSRTSTAPRHSSSSPAQRTRTSSAATSTAPSSSPSQTSSDAQSSPASSSSSAGDG